MTKCIFTRLATQNLLTQAQYIYETTLDADKADRYLLTMKEHIKRTLGYFPSAGRSAEEFGKGIRKLVYQRYSILYRIEEGHILVITLYRENLPQL